MSNAQEREGTAFHEAGHAVVAAVLGVGLHSVMVGKTLGVMLHDKVDNDEIDLAIGLAGMMAVRMRGISTIAAHASYLDVEAINRLPPGAVDRVAATTMAILKQHWHRVEALAGELIRRCQLKGGQATAVIGSAQRPREIRVRL